MYTIFSNLCVLWTLLALINPTTVNGYPKSKYKDSRFLFQFPVPESLKSPFTPRYTILSNGGAANPLPASVNAFQFPSLGLNDAENGGRLQLDIREGLKHILETKNEYTFVLHGTGMTGMTAAFDNLVEKGDKVLVCGSEHWGLIAGDVAERLGANVTRFMKTNRSFNVAEIENAVIKHRPDVLFMFHGDSFSGVSQPLDGIGDICHRYNCLTIVDTVATIGQQPIQMDAMKIDAVFANSQKGCGGTVGLAPVSFSDRAVARMKRRRSPPVVRPTDIVSQARFWHVENSPGDGIAPHTPSFPLLYMFREGIAGVINEGLQNVWRRHANVSRFLYDEAALIPLKSVAPVPEERLQGTAVFELPRGKDAFKIAAYALRKHRVDILPGVAASAGKVLRVGLFGENANIDIAQIALNALRDAVHSRETDMDFS